MNIPSKKEEVPKRAKGNPVYEQTRQDMPLWCCGRNCGTTTRIVVIVLAILGMICSIWACLSVQYFSFVALRNDTFYDQDKQQPSPFEYAVEADVGLFKYRIMETFEYPTTTTSTRERALLEEMLLQEVQRLAEQQQQQQQAQEQTDPLKTKVQRNEEEETDPNVVIEETVDIGETKKYENGVGQFDSAFTNAQRGAILGPVFAGLGTFFALIELCLCTYKFSWVPTALFLSIAFMTQLFTMFLFLSEDFCKYAQDCALGVGGVMSVLAVICFFFAQCLSCCAPRPTPLFDIGSKTKTTTRRRKVPKDDNDDNDEDNNVYASNNNTTRSKKQSSSNRPKSGNNSSSSQQKKRKPKSGANGV